MKNLIRASLALTLITLAGCVPSWTLVEPGAYVNEGNFSIVLPTGWLKIENMNKNGLVASTDGPVLQSFAINHQSLEKAFKTTKAEINANTLSYELMEYYIAEVKANSTNQTVNIESKKAAMLSGKDGFRVVMQYKNEDGLRFKQITYGCINESEMYTLSYHAPVLYYFDKNVAEFETSTKSFLIL